MAIVIAHGGLPPKFTLGATFSQWSFDPIAFSLIVLTGLVYWWGLRRIRGQKPVFPGR